MPRKNVTKAEIYKKIADTWDFDEIIKPYEVGGTPDHPVKRTWGLVISWLVDKKRFPLDVIGAAMMLTVEKIKREGDFEDTGKHGSMGDQFDSNLLATCDLIQKQRLVNLTYKSIVESRGPHLQLFITRQVFNLIPWWVKMVSWKYWKYRCAVRKHGTS